MARGAKSRAQASRKALVTAFNGLFAARNYAHFGVAEIVRQAGVSRSTFYQHFKNKDDLFRNAFAPICRHLATACGSTADPKELVCWLEHFRNYRVRAMGIMNAPSANQVNAALAFHIDERLPTSAPAGMRQLVASQIAESQLGLIRAWLSKGCAEPVDAVAAALVNGTRALVEALT